MIRGACEHFGAKLLTNNEQKSIFTAIISGPSADRYRARAEDPYSEEAFKEYQRSFHYKQLRPFSSLLKGETKCYFEGLANEEWATKITDDSYSPFRSHGGGPISYNSPIPDEELKKLSDPELLEFLNSWNDEHRVDDNFLIEVNFFGLSGAFQRLFQEEIIPNSQRLSFWLDNKNKIIRPVYANGMLKVMHERVKKKNFEHLEQWIAFCAWILSKQDAPGEHGKTETLEEPFEVLPDWDSSRQDVAYFIRDCLGEQIDIPITVRSGIGNLLCLLCTQPDSRLDDEQPILLNRDDPLTDAINSTRGIAVESLVFFAYWIRRHLPDDSITELNDILNRRITNNAAIPLTRPEHALLGNHFGRLCFLNEEWTKRNKNALFPQQDKKNWSAAFGSYIYFNQPRRDAFDILRDDFSFALDNLELFESQKNANRDSVTKIGQHIFALYIWDAYPLQHETSLLERFYAKTYAHREYWAKLFSHIGSTLQASGSQLEQALVDRVTAFFDWRLSVAEPVEMQKYRSWLNAECLDPEWRLQSYLKTLEFGLNANIEIYRHLEALSEFLPHHLPLIVACFAKITDAINQESQLHFLGEKAKHILKVGLQTDDPSVQSVAEKSREKLLRLGYVDLLRFEK